jgi:PEP-CTERM motif-containing protein
MFIWELRSSAKKRSALLFSYEKSRARARVKVTKTFLLRAAILLGVLFIGGRSGTTQPAGVSFLAVDAAAVPLHVLRPPAFGSVSAKSGDLVRALADDQGNDQDHDGDHDRHRHKDPDPGPAPVPEPATVLLFGAALLTGGTIVRLRNRTVHK